MLKRIALFLALCLLTTPAYAFKHGVASVGCTAQTIANIPEAGGDDIFVHISNCAEDIEVLSKAQRVRFDERTSKRNGKPEAYAVALL